MTLVYATGDDYDEFAEEEWTGDDDALTKRLRNASIEVARLTRLAVYNTDVDGKPSDNDIGEAFAEATVAIVEYWGITEDPTGAEVFAGAVRIGSVSLGTTSSAQSTDSERDKLIRRIGTRAIDILTNAGLISGIVAHT